jgi:integrase
MSGPQRRRFGSIRRLASGRWQVRYRDALGQSHTAPSTFDTKSEAAKQLALIETDLVRGQWLDPNLGKISFAEWTAEWRATTVNLRYSTRVRDEHILAAHVLPAFGHRKLSEIDHLTVRAWVAALCAKNLAPATVVKAAQVLAKIMRTAVDAGLIATSPCDRVPLPHIERREMRCLTPEEVAALAEAMDPRYRPLVLLGAYSGLRAGELFGLRGYNVDPIRGRVDVVEIVVDVEGKLIFGPPKTRAGRRSVPLPSAIAGEIGAHMAEHGVGPQDFVFSRADRGAVRLNVWRTRFWLPAVERAGLGHVRIHDLRHTAVAMWIAAGASAKEVAVRAGHASVVTVLDRYGHLLPGTETKVNDALDEFIRQARDRSVATTKTVREMGPLS